MENFIIKEGIKFTPFYDENGKLVSTAEENYKRYLELQDQPKEVYISEQEKLNAQLLQTNAEQQLLNAQLLKEIADLKGGNA